MVSVPASSTGSADLGATPAHMNLKKEMNVVNTFVVVFFL